MQLEQHFVVASPVAAVWQAFHDPALLVSCLPGASLRGAVEDGKWPLSFKVKLGPIAAAFNGDGTLALDEAQHQGAFSGQAVDPKSSSRVKGEARFRAEADPAGTKVIVSVDFTITGKLAQFSREGIVRALADQLTRDFAENLQAKLATTQTLASAAPDAAMDGRIAQEPAPAPQAGLHTPSPHSAASEAPSLNLLTLLLAMARRYWRRLMGQGS